MRDRSKQLLVINTGKKESEQTRLPAQSGTTHIIGGGGLSVNMSDYLLKSIWDKVFEIRTDSQGTEYIFSKLPMVAQYGITMYSGDGVDVHSLASGLPFDGCTIWYNPDTQQIEVIGGTGGGSGEGVSNFWDLSGIPSWITNSKPKYIYSEIEGTPDLSGFATQNWIISQGYASAEELKKYIPISGYTEVSGEKNFTGGLKVNGSPIYYDTEKKYWKLEGDLLVTGGVTMYGSDSSFVPSTIMDAILYDSATLGINSNGQLYVKGGTSGGGLDITALQNYLTSNSYLNVTSGDNRYLKLSGGTIKNGSTRNPLIIDTVNSTGSFLTFKTSNVNKAYVGYDSSLGALLQDAATNTAFNIQSLNAYIGNGNVKYKVFHEGNDGHGSGLDADLLDGVQSSGYGQYVDNLSINLNDARNGLRGGKLYNATNAYDSIDASYRGFLEYGSSGYRAQFNSSSSNDLYYRWCEANTWKPWRKVAFEDSNVASATKLQTSRTIWGQSFDGTENVSGVISNTHTIEFDTSSGAPVIGYLWTNTRGMHMDMSGLGTEQQGTNLTLTRYGNVGIGTASPSAKLHVSGDILATGGITMYSMRALKNVVDERGLSLSELSTIKPTRYTWKDGRDSRLHFGGIADDIQQVLPEVVYKTSEGILTMDYGNAAFAVASSLIQPVVDHEKRIAMLQERIEELEEEVERLKSA